MPPETLDTATAEALIGIDTLWGGDVMNPSGVGRFIADCWFSDEPLPVAYTHPAAAALRANGGVGAKAPDRAAVEAYLAAVDVRGAIGRLLRGRAVRPAACAADYLEGLGLCCEVMWDLAMELVGRGTAGPLRALRADDHRPRARAVAARARSASGWRNCWRRRGIRASDVRRRCSRRWTPGARRGACRRSPSRRSAMPSSRTTTRCRARHLAAVPAGGARARAAGQRALPRHRERVVLGIDELPRPRAARRTARRSTRPATS